MGRVLWRSWSKDCADFDFIRLAKIKFDNEWVNGHLVEPEPGDVWLTGNANDYRKGDFKKATIFAEPYIYLMGEYDRFQYDNRWDVRFTYNRDLLQYPATVRLPVAGYWEYDGKIRSSTVRDKTFGMALGCKPGPLAPSDIGQVRKEFVSALKDESFIYWGACWGPDQNYQGEVILSDNKFLDSQQLLSRTKFALALDNSIHDGYLTEKFWNSLAAGCVPIYFGHDSIKEKVPTDAFVYGYDFDSVGDVIAYCKGMEESEWRRRADVGFQFFRDDSIHSWEAIFKSVDEALG